MSTKGSSLFALVVAGGALILGACTTPGKVPAPQYTRDRATCINALAPRSPALFLERGYLPPGFQTEEVIWCSARTLDGGSVEITEHSSPTPDPILASLPSQFPYFTDACPTEGSTPTAVLVRGRNNSTVSLALSTLCDLPNSTMPMISVLRALEAAHWTTTRSYTV